MNTNLIEMEQRETRRRREVSQVLGDVLAKCNPDNLKKIAIQAIRAAADLQGIKEPLAALARVAAEQEQCERGMNQAVRDACIAMRENSTGDMLAGHPYGGDDDIMKTVKKRQELLATVMQALQRFEHRLTQLQRQEDVLLDEVWRATSGKEGCSFLQLVANLLAREFSDSASITANSSSQGRRLTDAEESK